MKTVISTPNAPGAIGPYSQGYAFGNLVITSGQIPVDPATGAIPEGIAAQAEQSRLQRGVRQVLHLQARPQLRGRAGAAQGRALRDRGHRRQVNPISSKESRSPEGAGSSV